MSGETTEPAEEVGEPIELAEIVSEPGVYTHISAEDYHRDKALSSSGSRKLLPPSCPEKFDHYRRHGRKPTKAFDLGHAAHKYVLGVGEELAVVDAKDWRTKAAKEAAAAARAEGKVPLLTHQHEQVLAMAAKIREHPIAGALFREGTGRAEHSVWWRDEHTGVMCRARFDWLPDIVPGRRMILPEYKTAAKADLEAIPRAMQEYGYHCQGAWYLDALDGTDLGGDQPAAFVLVFQEKEAPYCVSVVEPDTQSLRIGGYLNHQARELFAKCEQDNHWPSYSEQVERVSLPQWVLNDYGSEVM